MNENYLSDNLLDLVMHGLPAHPYPLHQFTAEDFCRLGDLRIIGEGTELIEGYIVHRGNWRLVAFFPSDFEAMVEHGLLRRGESVFVDGTIRDIPARDARM